MISQPGDRLIAPSLDLVRDLAQLVKIESIKPHNPVIVSKIPQPWQLLGTGNYAAVFVCPEYPDFVVKIYASGRSGWAEEVQVYEQLGYHESFSECSYAADNWLILKRLYGVTLYDCLHQGIKIPPKVIRDIDSALEYARSKGLTPHDVHGRNVMMFENKGLVVDISDFLDSSPCWAWQDLKKAYNWFYQPLLSWHSLPLPYVFLDGIRTIYRYYRIISGKYSRSN